MTYHNNILELIGNTPLVKLNKMAAGIEATVAELIQSGKIRSLKAGDHKCSELGSMVRDAVLARGRSKR